MEVRVLQGVPPRAGRLGRFSLPDQGLRQYLRTGLRAPQCARFGHSAGDYCPFSCPSWRTVPARWAHAQRHLEGSPAIRATVTLALRINGLTKGPQDSRAPELGSFAVLRPSKAQEGRTQRPSSPGSSGSTWRPGVWATSSPPRTIPRPTGRPSATIARPRSG